ncbi:MAG: cephalosporin hydroxylase family protein [Ferruginibacter sp.]
MDLSEQFNEECRKRVSEQGMDAELHKAASGFLTHSIRTQYSYNFKWLGRPVIQYPQDMIAMQEIIWDLKPDLIIETGIAHGGSLIFYASLFELIGHGEILGIDIDIRKHNREAIEEHPMYKRITMIQGSSISEETVEMVKTYVKGKEKVLIVLDSNHTHAHVLDELNYYAHLVTVGSYIVVFDTVVENLPEDSVPGIKRPWGLGNNPMTAVDKFLESNKQFEIDSTIDSKLLISVAPRGYLKRLW